MKRRLAAFGRPELSFSPGAARRTLAEAQAWDRANPELAAERARLLVELDDAITAKERQDAERDAAEKRLRQMSHRLADSGVGPRSLEAAAQPHETEAMGVVRRWLPESGLSWLVLCGAKGTGKSVAATWAVREVIRTGGSAAFRRASELAKLSAFDEGARELERLKHVHLLVLDDFGTELLTDFAKAQMHEVLDHRHENHERTILTSNLPWFAASLRGVAQPGLSTRLGERLVDRIEQAGRKVQLGASKSMRRGAA